MGGAITPSTLLRRPRGKPPLETALCALILIGAALPACAADDLALQTAGTGLGRYSRNRWGVRGVEISNMTNEPVQIGAAVAFEEDPLMEYARQAWIPAHSRRRLSVPVLPPTDGPPEIRVRTWLQTANRGAGDSLFAMQTPQADAESLPRAQPPVTVFLTDGDLIEPAQVAQAREAAVAVRLTVGGTRNVSELSAADFPALPQALDAADELVLAGNRIANSPASLGTLAAWLQRGGRLWIPLDLVEPQTVEQLLSDALQLTVVDRVRLAEVEFRNRLKGRVTGVRMTHDTPVDMVRVIPSAGNVLHEVNGWPASFWLPVGSGQVLFTTLSADAWMRPRRPHEQQTQLDRNSLFVAEAALDEFATQFTLPAQPPPLTPSDLAEYLSGDVGVRVPARATVLSILGAFWAAWLAVGFWLLRRARLERLAVVGPLLALLAAAPLAVLGNQLRSAAPPTAAVADFVEAGAGAATVHAIGAATLFVPEPTPAPIATDTGRLLIPQRDRLDGNRRQFRYADFDKWSWAELTLPTGLQTATTDDHRALAAPLRATATFGPDGLSGRLDADGYLEPTDALIAAAPSHVLAVRMQSDGRFTAGRSDRLPAGAFLTGPLLADQQRRRNLVYQKLLLPGRNSGYPVRPMLLTWTRPAATGLQFPEGMEQSATSLVAAPLEFSPPPAGSSVYIPPSLLVYGVTGAADGLPSTAFDPRTGRWQKSSAAVDLVLRFRVPDAVLPLELQQAALSLSVRAPARNVSLAKETADGPLPLAALEGPSGSHSLPIENAAALRIDDGGRVSIRLHVGDVQTAGMDAAELQGVDRTWQIERVELELSGRTQPRGAGGDAHQ